MTQPAQAEDQAPDVHRAAVRAALRRYQVMATVTGFMLLLLCTEMVLKYIVHLNGDQPVIGNWVAIVHGWIYVVYVICAFMLWSSAGWRLGRLFFLVIAGVVPLLSFIMEWRATGWVHAHDVADHGAARRTGQERTAGPST